MAITFAMMNDGLEHIGREPLSTREWDEVMDLDASVENLDTNQIIALGVFSPADLNTSHRNLLDESREIKDFLGV